LIHFEDVTKSYKKGQRAALNGVSLDIDRGEFVFLVGPSGSGKSTLMSLVLRESKPDDGLVQVAGRNLSTVPTRHVPIYRRKLGVVFQGFRLLQTKNVYENVSFALEVIGKPRHTINALVPEALKLVGLEGKENRMPYELSGGEQQRVAIARAFVNKPLVILADEPTGNLDPVTSVGIMKLFDEINKMGTTVLMATHNEEIVNAERRRVIELSQGKLIRDEKGGMYSVKVQDSKETAGARESVEEEYLAGAQEDVEEEYYLEEGDR
jgi:cell division transport system ATP-binding protein